jgi:pimeloyl-ACP methyl ester carboxylesterase
MSRRLALAVVLALVPAIAAARKPKWADLPLPPAMPQATATGHVDMPDGAQIYYAVYGKDGAADPTVILLHGGLGNADHFAHQVPALADQYRVIAIDSRGQGRSTLAKGKLSYHTMASDVIAVMDSLGLKRASIVGWSDGGAIALDLGISYPDRVERLFVFGTNYDSAGSKRPKGNPGTFAIYQSKCRRDFNRMAKDPKSYEATVAALVPVWRQPGSFTKDQLRSIKAPTLLADGDHDEIIELDQVKEMATLIPNGKLMVLKDTSHFALWQDPTAFNKAIVDFLAEPAPAAPAAAR